MSGQISITSLSSELKKLPDCFHATNVEAPKTIYHPSDPQYILMTSIGLNPCYGELGGKDFKKLNYVNYFVLLNTNNKKKIYACTLCPNNSETISAENNEHLRSHLINLHWLKLSYKELQLVYNTDPAKVKSQNAKLLSKINMQEQSWNQTKLITNYD